MERRVTDKDARAVHGRTGAGTGARPYNGTVAPNHAARCSVPPRDTIVRVGGTLIGCGPVTFLARIPLSVSMGQAVRSAIGARARGASILRAGPCPVGGHSLGEVEFLCEVGERVGLPVAVEVDSLQALDRATGRVHLIELAQRCMQDFPLLAAAGRQRTPVLLRRGLMSTIEEFLLAAEYILSEGNPQVVLCECGVRSFDPGVERSLDIASIPLLALRSHLPIAVDPSDAAAASLVPVLTRAAIAAGADAVLMDAQRSTGRP